MLELVKQNIHMNRWKNRVETQITLDDDFIVPDTMNDMAEVILDAGELQLEPVKIQNERAIVRGKLDFHVLYRKEEGGLQTLGGLIPFEENVNVPGLEDKNYVSVSWQLEDLNVEMINSRKLSVKAIIMLEVKAEELFDTEAAEDVRCNPAEGKAAPNMELLKDKVDVAAIALRRKDTYRLKDVITLTGNKPAIDRILWTEMRLSGVSTRPLDGQIHLEGSLMIFMAYEGEGENTTLQWLEESLPFSGEIEMQGAVEEMIPAISVRLVHKDLEEKPDYVLEMASVQSIRDMAVPVLRQGCSLVPLSIGAFSDRAFYEEVQAAAREGGAKVHIPSGAVGGFDVLQTISLMAHAEGAQLQAGIETRKGPASLQNTSLYEDALMTEEADKQVFCGTAQEAIALLPTKVNVAVATALASAGPEHTTARIVSVPGMAGDDHKLTVEMDGMKAVVDIYSRTASIAGWSVVALLRNLASPVVFY